MSEGASLGKALGEAERGERLLEVGRGAKLRNVARLGEIGRGWEKKGEGPSAKLGEIC